MTSVDELFKQNLAGNSKRKYESIQDPNELYKSAKLDGNGDARSKGRHAVVEEDEAMDAEAGPELPPMEGEDVPDDEDGRFFDGGMEQMTAEAMQYIDQVEEDDVRPETFDATWVRRFALNFERKISKNSELRAKFENDPQKFMASEADLDSEIKGLSILSEHPELYEEFCRLGCIGSLASLLSHENTDIAIDAIQIIGELTDEDVEAEQVQWDTLVNAMIDADLVELLTQNLARLDESSETDRAGVYYVLNVLENLASQDAVAGKIGQDTSLLPWIISRIQQKESQTSQNTQYAAEILAILLQSSTHNRARFIGLDGIDVILQLLSQYRRREPEKDSNEEEYVENLFDSLVCLVDEVSGKEKFVEAEGIELALIMLRESKFSRPRALRLLDHTFGGAAGGLACEHFVEAAGLKTVFGMFMKKQESQSIEHILGIFASLLRLLPGESASRIRALAKFMEKDYEKVVKLVKLRREYATRLTPVVQAIESEQRALPPAERDAMAAEWLSRRFDAGLFSLQAIDVILAWLIAEDSGARRRITAILADSGEDVSFIRATLQEQLDELDEQAAGNKDMADMLGTLLQFV